MNYHIMVDDKFIDSFIEDAEKVSSNNRYLIRAQKRNARYVSHYKAEWDLNIEKILNDVTKSDRIFIHWYDLSIGKNILAIDKNIPVYVTHWGGDIFEDPFNYNIGWIHDPITLKYVKRKYIIGSHFPKRPDKLILLFFKYFFYKHFDKKNFIVKRKTMQRVNFFLIHKNNYFEKALIKKTYDLSNISFLPYFYNQNFDLAKKILNSNKFKNNSSETIIQLGNSDTESNNHVDCLKKLSQYSSYGLKLFIPLSYGNQEYREFVKYNAIKYFNDKVNFQETFVSRETFVENLFNIDICVMFHNRSQALGNCITLLTLGKKLYLKKINPLYHLFKDSGIKIFDADNIGQLPFKDFSSPLSKEDSDKNYKILADLFSESVRFENLRKILN